MTLAVAPLANDSSSSGRPLGLACFSQPAGSPVPGPVSLGPDGTLLFTGTPPRAFVYEVSQEGGGRARGTVVVTSGFEHEAPPVMTTDSETVEEGSGSILIDVLQNDSGVPADIASVQGADGQVSIVPAEPREVLQYTPVDCLGTPPCVDEFTYQVVVGPETFSGVVQVTIVAAPPPSNTTPPKAIIEALIRDPNQGETQLFAAFDGKNLSRAYGGRFVTTTCWQWGDEPPGSPPEQCYASGQTVGCVYYPGRDTCYWRRERHAYPGVGTYTVRLKVQDSGMYWSTWTEKQIYLANQAPEIALAEISCFALTCSFDASASHDDFDTGALTFDWSFGDPTGLEHDAVVSHTYPDLGTYPLHLIVTDTLGASRSVERLVDIVDRPPAAHFSVASTCGDRCLSFTATTVDDFGLAGHEWRWTRVADGAAGLLGVGPTASLTTSTLGLYDVTLASTDGAGQTGTLTQRVHLSGALLAATDWWILPSGATEIALDPRSNDGPGSGLVISSFGQGQYGAVSTGLNGTLRYQLTGPRPTATDRFAYTVTDSLGNTAMGSVRIVTRPIGEMGRAEGVTDVAAGVSFARDYGTAPLVFALPASANDPEPATARITSVKPADFSVKVQEPANGVHGPETVDYLVIAPPWVGADGTGVGTLEDGRPFAAGRLTLGLTLGNGTGDALDRWAYVSLPRTIGAAGLPVVLAQVQSDNDPAWVSVRLDRVDATGFRIALEVPEAANGHGAETVAWVAFPASASPASDPLLSEAAATGSKFEGTFQRFSLGRRYPVPPLVVATLRSRNDGDPATLRRRLVDVSGVELSVQEDATLDAESVHGLEDVSLVAFAEPAVLAGSTRTLLAGDGGGLVGRGDRFQVWASKDSMLPVLWNDQPGTGDLELLGFVQPVHGRLSRIAAGAPPPTGELPLDLGLEGGLGGETGGEFPVGGDLLYQPPTPEFRGWDSFEYTVRDGSGDRATLIVWIEVVGENEQ